MHMSPSRPKAESLRCIARPLLVSSLAAPPADVERRESRMEARGSECRLKSGPSIGNNRCFWVDFRIDRSNRTTIFLWADLNTV
jgi:hypothetical protein